MCKSPGQCDKRPVRNYQLQVKVAKHLCICPEENPDWAENYSIFPLYVLNPKIKDFAIKYSCAQVKLCCQFARWGRASARNAPAIINHLIGLLSCWGLSGFCFWGFSTRLSTVELTALILNYFHSSFTEYFFYSTFHSFTIYCSLFPSWGWRYVPVETKQRVHL